MFDKNTAFTCDGNLALDYTTSQKFIVIDGGGDKKFVPKTHPQSFSTIKCTHSSRSLVQTVALAAISCVLFAFAVALASVYVDFVLPARYDAALKSVPLEEVTIESGDNLWTIASAHTPKGSTIDATLTYIKETNNLDQSDVSVGQTLLVPDVA